MFTDLRVFTPTFGHDVHFLINRHVLFRVNENMYMMAVPSMDNYDHPEIMQVLVREVDGDKEYIIFRTGKNAGVLMGDLDFCFMDTYKNFPEDKYKLYDIEDVVKRLNRYLYEVV